MDYRPARSADYDAIRQFLADNGWAERVADAARFYAMLDNADRTVVAVDDQGSIVGFGRALCDGVSNGYIGTVAVAESVRRRGAGREIVRRLMGDDPAITWVLRAGHGSNGFWERMGFKTSEAAMERRRVRG